MHGLQALPNRIEQMLSQTSVLSSWQSASISTMLFLGRGDQYPIAMEGALKLKEISYIHAGSFRGGRA
ncbi:SIS domain-containing protein [Klebsiella pneumoniae]|nr:SIS domain-containing protein [Klebsiella pneumoniae]